MKAELIDRMGTDLSVVNSARVSFDKHHEVFWEEDERLIKYLARHNHWTPFSHVMITMRETVPIFVARQRFKHVVGFTYNEVSRRYVDDEPEFYYPDEWRTKPIGSVKQGSGTEKLPQPEFEYGYCRQCGKETIPTIRLQGGGKARIYCSDECKYKYNNLNRNPYKAIWNNASARAKREGKEWSIEFDTFEFPSHCPILGLELDYSIGKGRIQDNSPSFDRLDPDKDYIKGNVRLVSNKANTMKSNASADELVTFAKNILLQYKGVVIKDDFGYDGVIQKAKQLYKTMIDQGYAAEQARMVLPQSMYTSYYVTGSLAAWARAYNLRSEEHAQKEIQDLAAQWNDIISGIDELKYSWKALTTIS